MPTIEIEADVHAYILALKRTTGDSESVILRRAFELPSLNGGGPVTAVPAPRTSSAKDPRTQSLHDLIDGPHFRLSRNVTEKFLTLLGFLYKQQNKQFERVLEISGRHRRYFAKSPEEIADSGRSLHPREISGSGYWVMTNADTDHKQEIIRRVLAALGYDRDTAKYAANAIA